MEDRGAEERATGAATGTLMTAAEAAESYHATMLADRELASRTHRDLLRAHHEYGLMIRDRPLCNVLRPRFLDGTSAAVLARAARIIAELLERAGQHLLTSDRLLDPVGASEAERDVWSIDPGYRDLTVTSRLDSFMASGRIRFIEYNAESPAAIGFCDVLTEIFERLPAVRSWGQAPKQSADARDRLLDVLLQAYRDWGGTGRPSVAVIDWADVITRRDFELCAEQFRARGIPTVICDPRELERDRGGRVAHRGERIDLVYRRVLLHELLEKAPEARSLFDAYREGAVCVVNSPRSKLLHKKTVFAMLSEGTLGIDVTDEEQAVIDGTVPWTRTVRPGPTSYRGADVDLIRLLRDQRERFVLKPADDYGGRGIVLGWDSSEGQWDEALESSPDGELVVQERVEVPEEEYPVWRVAGNTRDEEETALLRLLVDTDPLMFKGRMGGILTRMSGSAVLNVTAGTGSSAPTFILSSGEAL
jgi:hypothetical protein